MWGQLGSAGAVVGPAADGTGEGRDRSMCEDAPVGAPGMLRSMTDRQTLQEPFLQHRSRSQIPNKINHGF